ncbi:MAG: DUF4920 domain-containing protein [Bacteroidetes bacterium]|nr:DUF4920 domain-containing protein [Bacteroidota bacterium]
MLLISLGCSQPETQNEDDAETEEQEETTGLEDSSIGYEEASLTAELITRGDEFDMNNAISFVQLKTSMGEEQEVEVTVKAKVNSVCQRKGCWMRVEGGEEEVMVRFKDYGFFIPMDCAGMTATMKGIAYYDTTSVDDLKHYAEDAGKSQEEIDAISEPEFTLVFEASGVVLH